MICREKYGTRKKSGKALSIEEKIAFVKDTVSGQGNMNACFVLNYGFEEQLPWPQVRQKIWLGLDKQPLVSKVMSSMNDKNPSNTLKLVPGTFGMNIPSSCSIVIIAGNKMLVNTLSVPKVSSQGRYLSQVDKVMAQVDRITEDISYRPWTSFIFGDEVHYSPTLR